MRVTSESTSALRVSISASPTSSVTNYKANAAPGGHFCEVMASTSPLTCTLSGLPAGELYTVQVIACLSDGVCSDPIDGANYTLPDGRSALSG